MPASSAVEAALKILAAIFGAIGGTECGDGLKGLICIAVKVVTTVERLANGIVVLAGALYSMCGLVCKSGDQGGF